MNTFANLAGLIMLDDKEYIEKSEKWILEEKKFMYKKLSEFQYIKAYKTECNFILIKLTNISSESLREKMIEKNILIRDASNFKFLDYHFVEFCANLPIGKKIYHGWSKYIMRKALSMPEAIKKRKDKIGFATPEDTWLKNEKEYFKGIFLATLF